MLFSVRFGDICLCSVAILTPANAGRGGAAVCQDVTCSCSAARVQANFLSTVRAHM